MVPAWRLLLGFWHVPSLPDELMRCDRMRRECDMRRIAFSLIELIVVVAIVTTIVGLMLPVLSRAKAEALSVPNASNLRQLHSAWAIYRSDHDDIMLGNFHGLVRTNVSLRALLDSPTDRERTGSGNAYRLLRPKALPQVAYRDSAVTLDDMFPPNAQQIDARRLCIIEKQEGLSFFPRECQWERNGDGVPLLCNGSFFRLSLSGAVTTHRVGLISVGPGRLYIPEDRHLASECSTKEF